MNTYKRRWLPGPLAMAVALVSGTACVGASNAPADSPTKTPVAARIGERQITLDEVDAKARTTNLQAYQQLYDARRAALMQIIDDQLLAEEAKARGVSGEELLRKEVEEKITPVTDAEIATFYNQNQARMGGQTLEVMKPRISQFLAGQRSNDVRRAFFEQLRSKAKLTIDLDPPRVDVAVAANDPAKGPGSAKVTIIEFSDFQ